MKKSGISVFLFIIILLLLILLGWTGCALYKAKGGHIFGGASDCKATPTAADCRAKITLGEPGVSVWEDGTVSLAAPLENEGRALASQVEVTAISLGAGGVTQPTTLPLKLAAIAMDHRDVVKAHVASVSVPGTYTLIVKGTYKDLAGAHSFDLKRTIKASRTVQGPLKALPINVVIHHTSGKPLPKGPKRSPLIDADNDRPARPLPDGPALKPFNVALTHTAPKKAPAPGAHGGGQSINLTRDTTSGDFLRFPPDPATSVANSAGVVVQTDNTFLDFSQDSGATFTRVDPTTIFPADDGGICCDQVVIYDPNTDLVFWLLQYWGAPPPAADPTGPGGPNRLRIAYAHPADLKANINAWTWFDLTQGMLNAQGNLDYPDLAVSGQYIWMSVNSNSSDGSSTGLTVTRFRLSDITSGAASINGATFGVNQDGDQARAWAGRLVQNSPDAAYWAGEVDTSHMQVFRWRDGDDNPSSNVVGVNSWCGDAADYANLAPDGYQWPDNAHAAGSGSIIAGARQPIRVQGPLGGAGQVWFGWGAGKDTAGCAQSGRPMPYVKIVQVDSNSLNAVGEYHIWNPAYAFAYPSLGTDPLGNIGVMVSYGGPSDFATTTVGYLGDYVVYYTEQSDATLQFYTYDSSNNLVTDAAGNPVTGTRYGDYFTVRNSGERNSSFSAQGYELRQIDPTIGKCLNGPAAPFNCTMHPHYIQWGRPTG